VDTLVFNAMKQRLDRIERQIRWWRFFGGSIAIVATLLVLFGARPSNIVEELRAKRFVIVGPNGTAVGEFSAREGVSTLKLSDASGKPRVVLSHGYDIPSGILILDGNQPRADLSLRLDDSVALDLFDKEGKLRSAIVVRADGATESR
jgi:hypothetical protein